MKYYVNCVIINVDTIDNFLESEVDMIDVEKIERLKRMVDRLEVALEKEIQERFFSKEEKELMDKNLIVNHLLNLEFYVHGLREIRRIKEHLRSGLTKRLEDFVEYAGTVLYITSKLDLASQDTVLHEVSIPYEVKRALSDALQNPSFAEDAKYIKKHFDNLPHRNFDYFDCNSVDFRTAKMVKSEMEFEKLVAGGNGPVYDITPKKSKRIRLAYGIEFECLSKEERDAIEESLIESVGIKYYTKYHFRAGVIRILSRYTVGTYYLYIPKI